MGRIIVYILIYAIVHMVVSNIALSGKINKSNGKGMTVKKKGVSLAFLIIAISFTILFLWIETMPSNIDGTNTKIVVNFVCGFFVFFWYMLSIMYGLWNITLREEEIWYRNYIGRIKKILYSEVVCYERLANGDIIFKTEKNGTLEVGAQSADEILSWISDRTKLYSETEKITKSEFIVRPAKYHKIVSVSSFVIFLIFLLLGVFTLNISCIILFAMCSILGIYLLNQMKEQYVVSNNSIVYKKHNGKSIELLFNEISNVEFKDEENVSYMLFYKKNLEKPVFKINTYYENAMALENLAREKRWL